MADVSISYKGNEIASMNATGVKTLLTSALFCEDDITVSYTKPSAPQPTLQSKTVSPSTSQQTVSPDSGYDGLSSVTVNAMPSGSASTPATTITANPTISVSNSGLITASVSGSQSVTPTVSAGYVSSGTSGTVTVSGSNTSQLTTQAAQTITPTTTDQTIASGKYLTGTQTIKGDANLVAANIADGVTIFGVTGTHSGGGGSTVNVTIVDSGGGIDEWYLPEAATRNGNVVSLPSDSMFAVHYSGMIDMVPTTGTVTRDIVGTRYDCILIYPGSNGGTITLEGF